MAWISVYQQVNGAKLRTLAKALKCSRHEALGIVVTLWLWAVDNADPDGLLLSADREDVAEAIMVGLSPSLAPGKVVDALVDARWIDEIEGDLFVHDWREYQEPYCKYVEGRQKNAERVRAHRNKRAETPPTPPSPRPDPPPADPPPTPPTPPSNGGSGCIADEITDEELAAMHEQEAKKLKKRAALKGTAEALMDEQERQRRWKLNEDVSSIEQVFRACGMSFTLQTAKEVEKLLEDYSADEICNAAAIANKRGSRNLSYIEGILKRGGGRNGGGDSGGVGGSAQDGKGRGGDGAGQSRYGLRTDRV